MVSFPISRRALMKVLLSAVILGLAGARAGGISDDEIDTAVKVATVGLKREMNSLQEQLELFEMKHETLQAASEQFRMQSKSAKSKLEDERRRYNILAAEKESLEMSIASKVALALEDQKEMFEDKIAVEHIEKRKKLAKENEELNKKLRRTEYQMSMLEDSMKEKMQEQMKLHEVNEGKRKSSEKKLRNQIASLTKTLSYTEKQAKSFEDSWKHAVMESEAKDEFFHEESGKRLNEARRWEQRLQKLNAETKALFEENKEKEVELIRSKKIHMTLLEKLQASDEEVKEQEAKVRVFTSDIEKLSKNLESTSGELVQSKKEHASMVDKFEYLSHLHEDTEFILESVRTEGERTATKNAELQNEVVDLKFELETSQNKTAQTIEERSEMTKTYTEALEQLSSKNSFLRTELVDITFELEKRQDETESLNKEVLDLTNAHKNALGQLESESKKLKILRTDYSSLTKDFEAITERFNESERKVENFQRRLQDEAAAKAGLQKELLQSKLRVENSQENESDMSDKKRELLTMYEKVQKSLERSEMKLLETKQQYQQSEDKVGFLEGSVAELEQKVEVLIQELELKATKNSYLQKTLLETKYDLEESQIKVKLLEAQVAEKSSSDKHAGLIEIENKKIMERAQALEKALLESNALYDSASQKIHDLRDQLDATETRSSRILNMYESMKEENDALTRSLRASEMYKGEFYSSNQMLSEQKESFEQCGKDLLDAQADYSRLRHEYDAAKEKIREGAYGAKSSFTTEKPKGVIDEVEDKSKSTTERKKTKTKDQSRGGFSSFLSWLDYALYTILRVIVDLIGFLVKGLWQSSSFITTLISPFKSMFEFVSWASMELRVIHDALVSLFEFEMTFVSSLVSSENNRNSFEFWIRNSESFVLFGEAIAILLCIDFIVSSFLHPVRARKHRPRAKTIHVPKSANASLLRKANNM